jgi:uncharacterized membrane protein YqjE
MFDLFKLFKIDNIFNSLTGFIETKIEYYKLQFREEVARTFAMLIFAFFMSMIMLLFLIFLSFFLVAFLNSAFSSQYLGFLIIAVFYLLLGIILFVFREKLIFEKIHREFFKKDKNIKVG